MFCPKISQLHVLIQPESSDLSLHTPSAKAKTIVRKLNLSNNLLTNLKISSRITPKSTNATIVKFSTSFGETHSGRYFSLLSSEMTLDTYED